MGTNGKESVKDKKEEWPEPRNNLDALQQKNGTEEWIRKMWYIYTMEYYAAQKKNDIMKFAGKWMELENVILSKCLDE
ncbi:hypothetical protein STEG23_020486 [Scotinomys teguina]